MPAFEPSDWIALSVYFLVVLGVAVWATLGWRAGPRTSEEYFLAGRGAGWFVVGGSLFATNIGSEHFVGLAEEGANAGVIAGQFEILASLVLLLLGWVFAPVFIRSGVTTVPELLGRRYSSSVRWCVAIVSIVSYVVTKICVMLVAAGLVFETLVGVDFRIGAFVLVAATGLYTIIGGLRAVLYTNIVQLVVLLIGATCLTVLGLNEVGGWDALRTSLDGAAFDMWRPMDDPDFPWTGIVLGAPILGVWYWCTDQFIVQRVLAARSVTVARQGAVFAALLKVLPIFMLVVPGLVVAALQQQGRLDVARSETALSALITTVVPAGLKGIVVAGLLAALMSSLSSVFNACATLVTWDVYRKIHPEASEKQLVLVGQVATLILVGLGLMWVPLMDLISQQLYSYLQTVQAYIAPPIACVFLFGMFWRHANAKGAIAALAVGLGVAVGRALLEFIVEDRTGALATLNELNFLHFAFLLFVLCSLVLIVFSLASAPSRTESAERSLARAHFEGTYRRSDILLSLLVAALVIAVWLYFR